MNAPALPTPLQQIVKLLLDAPRVAVMTGAGMSAESGIPTFRGQQNGLWTRFDPQQLATAEAYQSDKALVWGWYQWRTALVKQAVPNTGHLALAALEQMKPEMVVVTQNVDDLHERAGSRNVVHLHGSLFSPRCFSCARPHPPVPLRASRNAGAELRVDPPHCIDCGGPIRPGVVWFGEPLPQGPWARAVQAMRECDVLFVVGSSAIVQPAAGLPLLVKERGKRVVQINPESTALDPIADINWQATAAEALPAIIDGRRADPAVERD